MTNQEAIMVSIIHGKCDHVQDFMDQGDTEAAGQALEEIQEFCNYMYTGELNKQPANTKEEQNELFDQITTRKLF